MRLPSFVVPKNGNRFVRRNTANCWSDVSKSCGALMFKFSLLISLAGDEGGITSLAALAARRVFIVRSSHIRFLRFSRCTGRLNPLLQPPLEVLLSDANIPA